MNGLDLQEVDCPTDVVDRLLWRGAQRILERHVSGVDGVCRCCARQEPCSPRRLAQRAAAKARQPWHDGWIARNEISRLLPAAETDFVPVVPGPRYRNERDF